MESTSGIFIIEPNKDILGLVTEILYYNASLTFAGCAGNGKEGIERIKDLTPAVVIIDLDLPGGDGFGVAQAVAKDVQSSVVLVGSKVSPDDFRKALQIGAKDLLKKPLDKDELYLALINAANESRHAAAVPEKPLERQRRGKVVTIMSMKGGVGKTTVAANLATSLAGRAKGRRVALVDLDLEFGVCALLFGLKPYATIVDLCRVEGEIGAGRLDKVLLTHPYTGIKLLAAPPSPEQAAEVEGDGRRDRDRNYLDEILEELRRQFDYVLIDTASNFRETNLTALDKSDLVYVLATPDIPCLQNTAKCLNLLQKLDYGEDTVRLILNRASGAVGLEEAEIKKGLSYSISHVIPSDGPTAVWAANVGQPFVISRPKAAIAKSIGDLAAHLTAPAKSMPALAEALPAAGRRKGLFAF